jgi:acetyl-CoA C-acetyltransferase
MATREIVLCEAVRTPIGAYDGSLKTTSAPDLGAIAIKAVLDRSKLDAAKVGTVVMGNVIQAGNKMNPARQSAVYCDTGRCSRHACASIAGPFLI